MLKHYTRRGEWKSPSRIKIIHFLTMTLLTVCKWMNSPGKLQEICEEDLSQNTEKSVYWRHLCVCRHCEWRNVELMKVEHEKWLLFTHHTELRITFTCLNTFQETVDKFLSAPRKWIPILTSFKMHNIERHKKSVLKSIMLLLLQRQTVGDSNLSTSFKLYLAYLWHAWSSLSSRAFHSRM